MGLFGAGAEALPPPKSPSKRLGGEDFGGVVALLDADAATGLGVNEGAWTGFEGVGACFLDAKRPSNKPGGEDFFSGATTIAGLGTGTDGFADAPTAAFGGAGIDTVLGTDDTFGEASAGALAKRPSNRPGGGVFCWVLTGAGTTVGFISGASGFLAAGAVREEKSRLGSARDKIK